MLRNLGQIKKSPNPRHQEFGDSIPKGGGWGSNPRHSEPQSDALYGIEKLRFPMQPTELHHLTNIYKPVNELS